MPLIDEYYYCASDLILPQWISNEKSVQTLLLSSDCCFCYGSRLCIWTYTCNASWSNVYSLWPTDVPVSCYHISMSNIFSLLISYSSIIVRLFLGMILRFHHGQYISELGFISPIFRFFFFRPEYSTHSLSRLKIQCRSSERRSLPSAGSSLPTMAVVKK